MYLRFFFLIDKYEFQQYGFLYQTDNSKPFPAKSFSLSSPNRMVIVFKGLDKSIKIKSKEIRGPKIEAPDQAVEGFIKSNKIDRKNLYSKKTDKGEFYFYKTKSKSLKIYDFLTDFIPKILENINGKSQ